MKQNLLFLLWTFLAINSVVAQQFLDETIQHNGETRAYKIYVPASYNDSIPFPLMFNFHGGDGNIASQIAIADMRPIADTANFIIVYPQALADPNDGNSTIWTHKEPTGVDDIFFVEAMIDEVAATYLIDEKRVYACGYSNGGEFSFELACRLSDKIAAIGVVARSMFIDTFNECAPGHPTAVITIHGTKDAYEGLVWDGITYYVSLEEVNNFWADFNSIATAPQIIQLPDLNTSDGNTVEQYLWTEGDGCVGVKHLKVIDGGHDWPGSFGNMDIDGTTEIWNFVSQYNIDGLITCTFTDVSHFETRTISVYPNPFIDALHIKTSENKPLAYQIYATNGILLHSGQLNFPVNKINLATFPATILLLQIGNQSFKLVAK